MSFNGEYIPTGFVSVSSLIEDDNKPDVIVEAYTAALLGGLDTLGTAIAGMSQSISTRARLYEKDAENSIGGLPVIKIGIPIDVEAELLEIVGSFHHALETPVLYETSLAPPYIDFFVRTYLIQTYEYDLATGSLANSPSISLYDNFLDGLELIDATTVRATYRWIDTDDSNIVKYSTEDLTPITPIYLDRDYYHVTYTLLDDVPTVYYTWAYDTTSGEYPELTTAILGTEILQCMPLSVIRSFNVDTVNHSNASYVTWETKRLKKLGIDLQAFTDGINDNPDEAQIDDSFVMFGVDIFSDKPENIKYVYDFFKLLKDEMVYTEGDYIAWTTSPPTATYMPSVPHNTAVLEVNNFNLETMFNFIKEEIIGTSIGPTGTITSTILETAQEVKIPLEEGGLLLLNYAETSSLEIKYAHSDTAHTSILVHGLLQETDLRVGDVLNGYVARTTIADGVANVAAGGHSGIIIPIVPSLLDGLSPTAKDIIFYDALTFMTYSVEIVYLDWYETESFGNFIDFVSFTIQAVSLISSFGTSAGTGTTFISSVFAGIKGALISYAVGVAIEIIVEELVAELGEENALIIAVVATVASFIWGDGSIQGTSLSWASTLMKVATATIEAVNISIAQQELALEAEFREFAELVKEEQEQLDSVQALITQSNTSLAAVLVDRVLPYNDFNESPTEFFNRTTSANNPGVATKDQISIYVKNQLRLPKPPPPKKQFNRYANQAEQ